MFNRGSREENSSRLPDFSPRAAVWVLRARRRASCRNAHGRSWLMGTALAARQCVACHGGMPAVAEETIPSLMTELDPGWRVEEGKKLLRTYQVPDFNA